MNDWQPHKFERRAPFLEKRMRMMRTVRRFFDAQDFWEVETPILQNCPTVDTHIHGFKTQLKGVDLKPARDLYLHASPEFAMKKLLVAGLPKIYQISHVFRNGEASPLHSPEFTMIEWYRAHADYEDIMNDCVALLQYVASALEIDHYTYKTKSCDPFLKWNFVSVAEAFENYAQIDLASYLNDTQAFSAALQSAGLRVAADDAWDDLFFRVMAEKIEPHLGMSVPTILYDYPTSMASLARKKPDDPRFAERFELYVCGVELANAFSELTDAKEQRARIEADMALKEKRYGERYPVDEDFLKALEHGLPESGGIALGLDRLAMLCTGAETVEQVLWMSV
jgi:lysyl-tRNA synthetase class 2